MEGLKTLNGRLLAAQWGVIGCFFAATLLSGLRWHVGWVHDTMPPPWKFRHVPANDLRLRIADEELVQSVCIGEHCRAYPLVLGPANHVLNDQVGDTPIAVTYCPLLKQRSVVDRRHPLGLLDLEMTGQSGPGRLHDRKTDVTWLQENCEGLDGQTSLREVPSTLETWADWKALHPNGLVLVTPDLLDEPVPLRRVAAEVVSLRSLSALPIHLAMDLSTSTAAVMATLLFLSIVVLRLMREQRRLRREIEALSEKKASDSEDPQPG